MGNSSMQRIALFEPSPFDLQPRSDLIRIRGEAQRLHDSDVIEVEVPGFPVVQAHWQETRLNFQKSVLAVDSRYTRLFFLDFDASSLPDGRVPIQIRLRSEGEIIGKVETAVVVDHDRGFRSAYERWMEEFERPAEALMQLRLEAIESRPTIGILLLVSDADDEAHVGRAIHSIMQQSYPDWQLMVVPSSAVRAGVLEAVRELTEHDNRIRIAEPSEIPTSRGTTEGPLANFKVSTSQFCAQPTNWLPPPWRTSPRDWKSIRTRICCMPMKIASMRAGSGRTHSLNPTGRRICSCHLITSAPSSSYEKAFWRILNRSPLRRKGLLSTT